MMELEYIPLKTADGNVCGYACAKGGYVTLSLRAHMAGDAHVFMEDGYVTAPVSARIRVNGGVRAVAVLKAGNLYCTGFGRGGKMTMESLRARLVETRTKPAPPVPPGNTRQVPPPSAAASAKAQPPPPERGGAGTIEEQKAAPAQKWAAPGKKAEPGTAPGSEKPVGEEKEAPFHPDAAVVQALRRLAGSAAEEFLSPPVQAGQEAGVIETEPLDLQDQPGEAATFAALFSRAEEVFARADAAPEHPAPEMPAFSDTDSAPARETGVPAPIRRQEPQPAQSFQIRTQEEEENPWSASRRQSPAPSHEGGGQPPRQYSPRDWAAEVEGMLQSASAVPTRVNVPNPFPHIFPEARFVRETDDGGSRLLGRWRRGNESFLVTAILGEYSPEPPAHLSGFTRYIRTRSGGYWVRVEDE